MADVDELMGKRQRDLVESFEHYKDGWREMTEYRQ